MAFLYLLPSTQEFNPYINHGNEEYYMNLIADALVPFLHASGISFTRNTLEMTAASSIEESNSGEYDLHLALYSNAASEDLAGTLTGINVYYNPASEQSQRAAELIRDQLKEIYPNPDKVQIVPTTSIGEVNKVRAPGVLAELGYHDNLSDAEWIQSHIYEIARSMSKALTQYFYLPFLEPQLPQIGIVDLNWGYLNIRAAPSTDAAVVAQSFDGARLIIWNEYQDWFIIEWKGIEGYAHKDYITKEQR